MSTAVRRLADRVYDRQVELDVVARVQRGLPAERIRFRTPQTLADDASFAREILAELRTTEAESEDDRLTAGFLEHILGSRVGNAKCWR